MSSERRASSITELARVLPELGRIALVLPIVELGTRVTGPKRLVALARLLGGRAPRRSPEARRELRRLIDRVDGRISKRSMCYRRVLVEMTLDRGAAADRVFIGVNASGEPGSGHAWLADEGPAPEAYDALIEL